MENDKPIFTRHGQIFVNITDSSANLTHILTGVREEFGDEYVVVTADGLEVRDSSGTQGEDNFYGNDLFFTYVYIATLMQVLDFGK